MNWKFGWSRRSFLVALGAAAGSLFTPAELNAAGLLGEKAKPFPAFGPVGGTPASINSYRGAVNRKEMV
jgi:hypothetical protein